jgi:hypothetical protein
MSDSRVGEKIFIVHPFMRAVSRSGLWPDGLSALRLLRHHHGAAVKELQAGPKTPATLYQT